MPCFAKVSIETATILLFFVLRRQSDYSNNAVRYITVSTTLVKTLAGKSASGYSDGVGTAAAFNGPAGIAMDSACSFAIVVREGRAS